MAELYAEVRPGYPQALVERVLQLADLSEPGRILEVGCGPAKATLPFARRGHQMVCLEPGAALAALASEQLKAFPAVEVEVCRFEEYALPEERFDLLISAQAWHWVDPEIGDAKAAQALRPGGLIALFWNRPRLARSTLYDALDTVYRAEAPHLVQAIPPGGRAAITERIDDRIARSAVFDRPLIETFPWQEVYETERYLKLMATQSDHLLLEDEMRQRLFAELARVIDQAGGCIPVDYDAVLIAAHQNGSEA
ncbi:MAG: class I SAM-dependent methyltransferase [bacterium]|nr:class I SAM-dependent methyltransferase [bacterium]